MRGEGCNHFVERAKVWTCELTWETWLGWSIGTDSPQERILKTVRRDGLLALRVAGYRVVATNAGAQDGEVTGFDGNGIAQTVPIAPQG